MAFQGCNAALSMELHGAVLDLWARPWGCPRLLPTRAVSVPAVPRYRPVCGCVPLCLSTARCVDVSRGAGVSGHYPRSALLISDVQDAGQQRGEGGALLRLLWRERGAWLELVSAPAVPWGSPSPCQDGRRCHRG